MTLGEWLNVTATAVSLATLLAALIRDAKKTAAGEARTAARLAALANEVAQLRRETRGLAGRLEALAPLPPLGPGGRRRWEGRS